MPVLLVTWAYSNCPFAIALPTERTEAILHGLVEAFGFFGCAARVVVGQSEDGGAVHLQGPAAADSTSVISALASHYNFEPLFCMVRQPQEKPRVEGRVQFFQQDWATPVPVVKDLTELNAHLHGCCLRDRERTQANQTESIGQRFERERARRCPCRHGRSILHRCNRPRWTSIRPCASTTIATACRGCAPSAR